MTYTPKPQDLASLGSIADLDQVLEAVAERVHDAWSQGRINEGWLYGATVDREAKTHPSLVPYANLPENERELDRGTARAALAALLEHGYRITR